MKIIHKLFLTAAALVLTPSVFADEAITVNSHIQHNLSLSNALTAAQASIESCKAQGIFVSVSIVDSNGLLRVLLKADSASPLSTTLSQRKAFTAANFRKNTTLLADLSDTAVGRSEGVLMSAGGVLIKVDEVIYGAIGVSGADTGAKDDECAKAGMLAITESLKKISPKAKDDGEKSAEPKPK